MAQAGNSELVDSFEQFFRNYYDNEIKQLAQQYPNEQRSLHVDWQDLYRFDPDLADDFINQPNSSSATPRRRCGSTTSRSTSASARHTSGSETSPRRSHPRSGRYAPGT